MRLGDSRVCGLCIKRRIKETKEEEEEDNDNNKKKSSKRSIKRGEGEREGRKWKAESRIK